MVGAGNPEMPSGELRRLSAADTDFNKLFATLVVSAWVLVAVGVVPETAPELAPAKRLGADVCALVVGLPLLSLIVWGQFRLKVVETDGRRHSGP